ncbi:hypothetical protein HOY82DRAFT_600036 [Tuber indicum]|nr:hypothetical protein HOY82DRAFT_600036 [Tuber indicum]
MIRTESLTRQVLDLSGTAFSADSPPGSYSGQSVAANTTETWPSRLTPTTGFPEARPSSTWRLLLPVAASSDPKRSVQTMVRTMDQQSGRSGCGFKKPGPVRSKFWAAAKAVRCPGKAARCPENQKLSAKGQSA